MNTTLPIAATKWTIDSNQSDVLIKARHSIIAYIAGSINKFKGHIDIHEDEIEDASIEFCLDVNNTDNKLEQMDTHLRLNDFLDINEFPFINFKSTAFQKINNNINFLKGELTIHNITKVVELDAEFIGIRTYEGVEKAVFEVVGNINRKDFGLTSISNNQTGGLSLGQDIKLIANLEFSV
ncbi:YceI family protein [Flavobacterium degerlachei]|jgi:polyisoprenoid-binding protein YceI|uniref:Polyisoprenoid-binding protein YceI n=1 Tax=Flavobacterium degerlachei TaxID=229203 RepID=A0A1H2Q272_9FLAO|nr:YceI family protein [Flavobacterium degerlachei]SDW01140.1 Polyisoprenoid-binding protein YceI [Flavobacterium degerlachei]